MRTAYDVAIVGGGVVGCAIARELSKYRVNVCLLERELDVSLGTSCRNSGVLHSGINYKPGTLRAKLAVRGNAMMDDLCRDLKVKLKRIGKLTVALDKDDLPGLERIFAQGKANGAPGLEIIDQKRMREIQPDVEGIAALWSPSSSIISPYGLTIALAENARGRLHAGFRRTDRGRGDHRGRSRHPGGDQDRRALPRGDHQPERLHHGRED